jgi:glucose/arabinose dehydrogenase
LKPIAFSFGIVGLNTSPSAEVPDSEAVSMRAWLPVATVLFGAAVGLGFAQAGMPALLEGSAAFGDWRADEPGVRRHILPADLPRPYATPSAGNPSRVVPKPGAAQPNVPPGFHIALFASGLDGPRALAVAPNGDIFVSETQAGRVEVLRAADGAAKAQQTSHFADRLNGPFGLAFYPPGPDPRWLYVAETDKVVRYSYRSGDLIGRGPPQVVVPQLPRGGHWTRGIAFSNDGKRMFVSVGSLSNDAEGMRPRNAVEIANWETRHGLGAAWGTEAGRADVLVFDVDGKASRSFATGIRNCVGLAVDPVGGDVWCSTNERDGLGDDLVPDYVTRVRDGGFYGWPWYYIGDHEDPVHRGDRPDLKGRVTIPDVLIQAHSASLQLAFYQGTQFPPSYRGSVFVAEHGSWNRSQRTGYKVIRVVRRDDGLPTGEYEDFMTGFVTGDGNVWGRPVGVGVAHDGSLIVTEDANGTVWRIWYGAGG